jgi:1-aminocyclopropane-1-carboxylate deaminase/D-cysteine desulfhydrase-like pyridoxal-dependent ACC family enzyme
VLEILAQAADLGVAFDCVIHGSDSGGAQSGFALGFQGMNAGLRHVGVSAGRPRGELEARVYELACTAARHVGLASDIDRNAIAVTDQFVGTGYGSLSEPAHEAVRLTARLEGIMLDPVYTAKAMAALVAMIRAREFDRSQSVLFIHTGGVPAAFAYADELTA